MNKPETSKKIRHMLKKEFSLMYQSSENAYGALDYSGKGYITQDEFLNCYLIKDKLRISA
jgi:hypothetical protein